MERYAPYKYMRARSKAISSRLDWLLLQQGQGRVPTNFTHHKRSLRTSLSVLDELL